MGSSSRPVQFLDLDVCILDSMVCVSVNQSKPLTPLCPTSCHVSHIHRSWPFSVMFRVANQSKYNIRNALDRLVNRYELANAHPQTIPFLRQAMADFLAGNARASNRDRTNVCSLVLPFHPTYRRVLSQALATLQPPHLPDRLVISWRNVLPSIAGVVVRTISDAASGFVRQQFRENGREGRCFLFSSSRQTCNTSMLPYKSRLSDMLAIYSCESVQSGQHCMYINL